MFILDWQRSRHRLWMETEAYVCAQTHTHLSAHNALEWNMPSPCCVNINTDWNPISSGVFISLLFPISLSPGFMWAVYKGHLSASLRSSTCFPSIFLPTWSCMPLSTLQCLIISKTCKCIHIHGGTDAKLTVAGTHLTVPASQSASSRYGGRDVEGGRSTRESENKEARGRRAGGGRKK